MMVLIVFSGGKVNMILRHCDLGNEKKLEKSMTIKEFIRDIILPDTNKEYKCYKITINESINGKQNLILYYQDHKIKSHHSTGVEFDYKEILNNKICLHYLEKVIRAEDIVSMDLDYEPSKDRKKLNNEIYNAEEFKKKIEQEILKRNNIEEIFKGDVSKENLIACIRQLVENLEKQNLENCELRNQLDCCKTKEDNLQQQIKWLEYRLNNKI